MPRHRPPVCGCTCTPDCRTSRASSVAIHVRFRFPSSHTSYTLLHIPLLLHQHVLSLLDVCLKLSPLAHPPQLSLLILNTSPCLFDGYCFRSASRGATPKPRAGICESRCARGQVHICSLTRLNLHSELFFLAHQLEEEYPQVHPHAKPPLLLSFGPPSPFLPQHTLMTAPSHLLSGPLQSCYTRGSLHSF